MDSDNILLIFLDSLPTIARITYGYAAITDKEGRRIKTVDSNGKELVHLKGVIYKLAKKAAENKKTISGMSQLEAGAESWCMPLGDYVLCCSNIERIKNNNDLKHSLVKSLPFIARVAGGEAVVFDKDGRRIASVNQNGNVNEKFIGTVSEDARQAMESQKPVIGQSNYVRGASAVRIPITKQFGFGFNNEGTILESQKLMNEVQKYKTAKYNFSDIIGDSPQMKRTKEIALVAAKSSSNVLIYGETGTGKELFAQSIHNASERCNAPFIAVNCAAIPKNLIESTLFGYDSGAFTGAKKGGNAGVFEQANGGTLFLDEISEMELDLQSKLLRVLQEREVTRIGGNKTIQLNIRVIAATNKRLDDLIEENKFRRDLYYRLNVIDIQLEPLRNLKDDIPLIINDIIHKMNKEFSKFVEGVEKEAMDCLMNYDWPGNVRELVNCIERVFNVIGNDKYIAKRHLPYKIRKQDYLENKNGQGLDVLLSNYEKEVIEGALKKFGGNRAKTAEYLKISNTTLWRRIKTLGIKS